MKSFLLLIFFFFLGINSSLAQQKAKETVFLKFDTTSTQKCKVAIAGKGYKMLDKFREEITKRYIIFHICGEKFMYKKGEAEKECLTPEEVDTINYKDIHYLQRVYRNKTPSDFKHRIFEKIYIVMKKSHLKYEKYEVGWIDEGFIISN